MKIWVNSTPLESQISCTKSKSTCFTTVINSLIGHTTDSLVDSVKGPSFGCDFSATFVSTKTPIGVVKTFDACGVVSSTIILAPTLI
jgi:hypothetical protein